MMFEHIIYTTAIIILIGIFYTRYTGKEYHWWIILAASFIPDLDHLHHFPYYLGLTRIDSHQNNIAPWIEIGDLHSLLMMILLSLILAWCITIVTKIKFRDGLFFCLIGYGIHLLEDFISYPPVYKLLYPLTSQPIGINLIPETYNFFGVAGTEVLEIGIVFLVFSVMAYLYHKNGSILIKEPEEE